MQDLVNLCNEKPVAVTFESEQRTIQENISHILDRLKARGIQQVVAVPLEHRHLPVSVVRVIVPGLEVDVRGEYIQLGLRAVSAMQGALQ